MWGGWSSQATPRAWPSGSGSREPRRPAGGGLGTDSGSRPSSRQPARKSCPPAPPIAAMRWAACRRSRSPTAGAVREDAPAGGPGPGRAAPRGAPAAPGQVDALTNAAAGALLGQACPERPRNAGATCRRSPRPRGVGTWQAQPAPISPRSMHAPSSRTGGARRVA